MKILPFVLGLLWSLTVSAVPLTRVASAPYSEVAVKAAFLYRFAGYVEWPEAKPADDSFTIAVLDADAVAAQLELLSSGRTIKGRPVEVQRIKNMQELGPAQLLYIGPQPRVDLERLVAEVAGRPVLVVTDHERGLDMGSTVNFLLVDRRVRFEVSLTAAERCRLNVSSELLSVAVRVRGNRLRSDVACAPDGPTADPAPHCILRLARAR